MAHPIIRALFGVKELPAPEAELTAKILNDNFVTLRAQELMVEHFAVEAIQKMNPLEITALIKRITPGPKNPDTVKWSFFDPDSNHYSFAIRGELRSEVRFIHAALPKFVKDQYTHPTREDIRNKIASAKWEHNGTVDRPSADLLAHFEQRMLALLPKEKAKNENA